MTFPTLRRRSCIHCKGSRTQGAELAARHAIVIAAGVLAPVLSPTVGAMFVYTAIVGVGYGAYMAVDLALMIDVLPSHGDVGKDLGVLNIAANVPQALTPPIAALLLGLFAGRAATR